MRTIIFYALAVLSMNVGAAKQTGVITGYIPYSNGGKEILLIKLENNLSGGCNITSRYGISSDSDRYEAIKPAIMAAFHAQTPIKVDYLESCNHLGNSWDINYICVGNINC